VPTDEIRTSSAAGSYVRALFWIGIYLALVLAPLVALLIGPTPASLGFHWDLSIALGFAATTMMGVQFLLTARFKKATAPYGIDIIYYFHRYLALVALALIAGHVVLLLAANPAFVDALNPFGAPAYQAAGVVSALAAVLLVATSLWRKRMRIPYEVWRIGHDLLALAAVVLAMVHIDGADHYLALPWKRALWVGISASWVAALGYVRLVKPFLLMRRPYRVGAVSPERGDAWTLVLEPVGHEGLSFRPGQFAWLTLGRHPFGMKEHPFSIASSPSRPEKLEFTIKELGDFTRTVKDVPKGARAYVDGPYGAFTMDRHPAPGYVFLAGGIGIAPIMSMLRALADRRDRRPLFLFYAYSRWDRMTFREEIEELKSRLDLRVVYVLGEPPDGWEGETGRIDRALLDRHLPADRKSFEFFICGPVPMIEAMESALHGLGIAARRVHTELFDLV